MKVLLVTRGWSGWPHFAGSTWVPIQYLHGLERLGVEAFWLDHLEPPDPAEALHGVDYLVGRFAATARDFGYAERWCVVEEGGRRYHGLSEEQARAAVEDAALLLSISGRGLPTALPLREVPRRAYVDVDPGYTQLWAMQPEVDMGLADYDLYFTVGRNVGTAACRTPSLGLEWHPIFPPVALDLWPGDVDERPLRYSTLGDWWGDQMVQYEGEFYGSKREEFLRLVDLPSRTDVRLEMALSIYQRDHEDIGLLTNHGWHLLDPTRAAGDPHAYRDFIRRSRAEFSVAKGGYVKSNSGWVSDRTACYLASGRPALVQSTGFEGSLATGEGLLTFRDVEGAVAGLAAIENDYRAHAEAARALAERHFDAERVLAGILERATS